LFIFVFVLKRNLSQPFNKIKKKLLLPFSCIFYAHTKKII
jgi:hypothetical protein